MAALISSTLRIKTILFLYITADVLSIVAELLRRMNWLDRDAM